MNWTNSYLYRVYTIRDGKSAPGVSRFFDVSVERHLLLIGSLALHGEWDVLVRQRFQSRLGDHVLARTKQPAGKASQQKGESTFFSIAIGKGNSDHGVCTCI